MRDNVILSALLTNASQMQRLAELPAAVSLVEVRADLIDVKLNDIKNATATPLLFSLRSKTEGGSFIGSVDLRVKTLVSACAHYDFIELEGERDLVLEILDVIPPQKRIITWHGEYESCEDLESRLKKYLATEARYYRLVIHAKNPGEELPVLQLLKTQNRSDLIAYATGSVGAWTQPLSAFLGSPLVPSSLSGDKQQRFFSVSQLMENYNLPQTYPLQKIFGIVGNPVFGSISPKLHNDAYRTLGLPYLYLPFHADSLQDFFDSVVNSNLLPVSLLGLTVVSPFKEAGLKVSGTTTDTDVFTSGASNMLLSQTNAGWDAMSTDALGVIDALNKTAKGWQRKKIVIVGCGGTGKTVAAALKRLKAKFTMVNRTVATGQKIANVLEVPFIPLNIFDPAAFNIIIHATPLGKNKGETPFDVTLLNHDSVVIDHVYSLPEETALVKYCRLCNITVTDGVEMARLQIMHQFKKMTNQAMPDLQQTNRTISETINLK